MACDRMLSRSSIYATTRFILPGIAHRFFAIAPSQPFIQIGDHMETKRSLPSRAHTTQAPVFPPWSGIASWHEAARKCFTWPPLSKPATLIQETDLFADVNERE